MTLRKRFAGKAVLTVLVIFILAASSTGLNAAVCERAFWRCLEDPFWAANYLGAVYCSVGYIFCKKYIE
jgi:hypothetical protein